MMKISSSVEYGMRVLVRLAKTGSAAPVTAEVLSVTENVPKDYVDQILRRLRQAGLVSSVRGPAGGYALGRPASEISVGDVVRAVEQEVFEKVCEKFSEGKQNCHHQDSCGLRPVWNGLSAVVSQYLDGITLESIVERKEAAIKE